MISYKRSIVIPSVISLVFILLGLGGLTRPEPSVGSVVYLIFLQPLLVYLYILRKQKAVFILTKQYLEFQKHFWSERQRHSLEEIAEIRYIVSPVYRGYQSKRLRIVGNKGGLLAVVNLNKLDGADFHDIYHFVEQVAPHIRWDF
ncbi:TPA: hypothetical protein U1405_000717 [Streptococcus suis]|uniref:hypothetical protein n=1 Tax=Streptococcus suis TaxID=1307 RepID=UPI00022F949B|nr:hypothetical protein [Streptococcus suis]AER21105.1 hypothetical protein SSUST1_0719 [Streptococcus suis ST1]MDW8592725.1 hypothetical protein [Streptococcus suis]MDW8622172.1 hypothetical protein [Streptococcus suis]NQK04293.1 hypothetical protein [Streptococcus suis]NQK13651.1 hypothetical protein [Streptococcus suis]